MSKKKWVGFPEDFKWGVGTAAHQIEGGNDKSDWWLFEQQPGKIKNGESSGEACDHWNRIESDTELLKSAGVKTYRFSVEWAKIEPEEGQFDEAVLSHYEKEVDLLIANRIEPMITLQHFTLPLWLARKGGWAWEEAPEAYLQFATRVYQRLGKKVQHWVTINEPMVCLVLGYLSGHSPPGGGGLEKMIRAMDGMIRGHALVYHQYKKLSKLLNAPMPKIGVAHHLRVFEPKRKWNPFDWIAVWGIARAFNWSFFEAVEKGILIFKVPRHVKIRKELEMAKGTQDFIGINYYSRDQVEFGFKYPFWFNISFRQDRPVNDVGWEIYPRGIFRVVDQACKRAPGKPVIITENGLADALDAKRSQFLRSHLFWLSRAIRKGIPVEGYLHWTIYDNFEWSEGFAPRFGLFSNDFKTQTRVPRPSLRTFKSIIQNNGFQLNDNELTRFWRQSLNIEFASKSSDNKS